MIHRTPIKQALETPWSGFLAMRLVCQLGIMPGAMSDADREFLKSMTVSLGNSQEANRKLVGHFLKIQAKNVDLENLRRDYVARNGRLDEGFRNEMSDFLQRSGVYDAVAAAGAQPTAVAASQRLRFEPSTGELVPAAAASSQSQQPVQRRPTPQVGAVEQGYVFKGGDPSKRESWELVR